MIFNIVGKDPKFFSAPIAVFDVIIGILSFFGQFFESMEDAAELVSALIVNYNFPEKNMIPNALRKIIGTNWKILRS